MSESEPGKNEPEHIPQNVDPIPFVDPVNEMPSQTETPATESDTNQSILCDSTVSSSQDINNATEQFGEFANISSLVTSHPTEQSEQSPTSAIDLMPSNNDNATEELDTPKIKVENVVSGDTNANPLLEQPTTSEHLVPNTPITEDTPAHSSDNLDFIKLELNKSCSSDEIASDVVGYIAPEQTNAQIVKVEEIGNVLEEIQSSEESEQMPSKEEAVNVKDVHDEELVASEVVQKSKADTENDEFSVKVEQESLPNVFVHEIEQAEPEATTSTAVKSEALDSNLIELEQEEEPKVAKQEATADGMDISTIVDDLGIATEANLITPEVDVVNQINITTTLNDMASCNVMESEEIEAATTDTDVVESKPIITDGTVSHDASSAIVNDIADTIAVDQIIDEAEPVDSVQKPCDPMDCHETSEENSAQSNEDLPDNGIEVNLNLTHEPNLTAPELVEPELQSPPKKNIGKFF